MNRLRIDVVAHLSLISSIASLFAILVNYAYFEVVGFRFIQFFSVGDFLMFAIENLPKVVAISGIAILIGFLPILVDWIARDVLAFAGRRYDKLHFWAIVTGLIVSALALVYTFAGNWLYNVNNVDDLVSRLVFAFPLVGFVVSLLHRFGIPPFRDGLAYIVCVLIMLSLFVYFMGERLARLDLDTGSIFIDAVEFNDGNSVSGHIMRALSTGVLFRRDNGETLFVPNDNVRFVRIRVRAPTPSAPTGDLVPEPN